MITDFLKTKRSKKKLRDTLDVIIEFKRHENEIEALHIPHQAWAKLEQLEEYLEHLVNDKPLQKDTLKYMDRGKFFE